MLVKIENVWIDPLKVEALSFDDGNIKITTATNSYAVKIHHKSINDQAEIINNALNTQSFGGETSEEKTPN